MRGRIDRYSHQSQRGIIRGEDGSDYPFSQDQWEAHGLPMPGMGVEFDAQGPTAINIRLLSGTMWSWLSAGPGQRSRTIAGLLAILFGSVGAHKVYMGKPAVGILHLILMGAGVFFWVVPNVILWDSPGAAFLICLLGWVAMFGIYFAGRTVCVRPLYAGDFDALAVPPVAVLPVSLAAQAHAKQPGRDRYGLHIGYAGHRALRLFGDPDCVFVLPSDHAHRFFHDCLVRRHRCR